MARSTVPRLASGVAVDMLAPSQVVTGILRIYIRTVRVKLPSQVGGGSVRLHCWMWQMEAVRHGLHKSTASRFVG